MNRLILLLLTATLFSNYGCSPKPDSNKIAEETNDSLVEQATPVQAEQLAADSKANAKDVAEFMVAVADAGHTLGALSQLGVERATNPAVKAFAQQALDQQREHESDLADVAQTYKIILPRALSTDNETRVNRLRDEKAGPNFDKAYLRYMVDINDQAISKAKKLVDNADSPAVKNLALTISADDEKQMNDADKLMNNVE
jgi:putative membrane protein